MKSFKKGLLLLASSLWLAGCSVESESDLREGGFDPKPQERAEEDELLQMAKRYRGQEKFANIRGGTWDGRMETGYALAATTRDSGKREVQESDVFKVGSKDSKLLYLLNNYRGLQVVSFEDGAEQPKIMGRVAPTGNYSERMYYIESAEQIVVLENNYQDNNGSYDYSTKQSRIILYNVQDKKQPKIDHVIELDGQVADSRLVGDVLYIATSVIPSYYEHDKNAQAKGMVFSIKFSDHGVIRDSLRKVNMSLPASFRENMNIVEVKEGDAYKYYLIAILSQSGWGWWESKSLVEVVDISDPDGLIKPLMVVSAKGRVDERSQTFIKDNHLVVVSNYEGENRDPQTGRSIARIAVETFALPAEKATIISAEEAEYRRLYIERELRNQNAKTNSDLHKQLVEDRKLGLKGVFVRVEGDKLRKVVSDSLVTVGDTTGLSASLQDVRVNGDHLYVFWVPSNNIDPLDLFDISDVKNGVNYIRRLQFDGWITRSEPVSYDGRNFVVGLGWIVPAVNNENNRRQPQVMLFEVIKHNNSYRVMDVAQYTLPMTSGWADFNRGDRYVDFRVDEQGRGSILFQVSTVVDEKYKNGGKIIGFDLQEAIAGNESAVFSEGGLLAVEDSNWLKRVFRNDEIEKINTFSDAELATFENEMDSSRSSDIIQAISTLELARNARGFIALEGSDLGVQIVVKGERGYYYNTETMPFTELRLTKDVDAEQNSVEQTLTLEGSFISKIATGKNEYLISTSAIIAVKNSSDASLNNVTYKKQNRVYHVVYHNDQMRIVSQMVLEDNENALAGDLPNFVYEPSSSYAGIHFLKIDSGDIIAFYGNAMYLYESRSKSLLRKLSFASCDVKETMTLSPILLSENLYLFGREYVKVKPQATSGSIIQLMRNYLAPMTIDVTVGTIQCGELVNIPGKPLTLIGSTLVTRDARLSEITTHESSYTNTNGQLVTNVYYTTEQDEILSSVKFEVGVKASMTDMYALSKNGQEQIEVLADDTLLLVRSETQQGSMYGGSYSYYPSQFRTMITSLFTDEDGFFAKTRMSHDFANQKMSLESVVNTGSDFGELLVMVSGRRVAIYSIHDGRSMKRLKLDTSTINGVLGKDGESILLPGWIGYSDLSVSYDAQHQRLIFSQGMAGLTEVSLSE